MSSQQQDQVQINRVVTQSILSGCSLHCSFDVKTQASCETSRRFNKSTTIPRTCAISWCGFGIGPTRLCCSPRQPRPEVHHRGAQNGNPGISAHTIALQPSLHQIIMGRGFNLPWGLSCQPTLSNNSCLLPTHREHSQPDLTCPCHLHEPMSNYSTLTG